MFVGKKDVVADEKAKRELNPLIGMMAAAAGAEDYELFAKEFAARKNEALSEAFAKVPFEKRILLLPQCLRSSAGCLAVEKGVAYECASCGACRIADIIVEAEKLSYMGVYILKGGRAVAQLIKDLKPEAIAGVACSYEGIIGILECERQKLPVQFIPLTKDGCVDTEVDMESIRGLLALHLEK